MLEAMVFLITFCGQTQYVIATGSEGYVLGSPAAITQSSKASQKYLRIHKAASDKRAIKYIDMAEQNEIMCI